MLRAQLPADRVGQWHRATGPEVALTSVGTALDSFSGRTSSMISVRSSSSGNSKANALITGGRGISQIGACVTIR